MATEESNKLPGWIWAIIIPVGALAVLNVALQITVLVIKLAAL